MIRFIDLGKQIGPGGVEDKDWSWPRQFCFFNTIYDNFVTLDGVQVWDSWKEFEKDYIEEFKDSDGRFGNYNIMRFKNLCPQWVFG